MPDTLLYTRENSRNAAISVLGEKGEAGMETDMMQSVLHNKQDLQNPRSRVNHCGKTGRDV